MSWDCDSDVLSMHRSVCSFVSNNGIAGGRRCGTPPLSGFGGFRKTAFGGCKALHGIIRLQTASFGAVFMLDVSVKMIVQ